MVDSAALGPDGDDLDWDHPEFQQYCEEQEQAVLKDWALRLEHLPFHLLLGADNGCSAGCCNIKIIPGEDLRTCSCEHKRPIFVPKGYDDVVSVGYEDGTNEEIFGCVCEVAPWEQPWAGTDDDGSSSED